ncbi:hypothetical protein CR205_08520 [Alteribacter lacisalsi]|uniref:Type II secretion system protein GspF domain-containing protein n=1 Tax=Alteribacter lacisalsi TaxID=2045244 RepID=A0A2W0HF32_9BACI|nr:type II secretion system F family protein [Alteribacter lacisalsi]PYZ98610.1 hypothetical protein CR205_08520 [Alteribacter lacisalsi]
MFRRKHPFKNDRERGEWFKQIASLTGEGYPLREALDILRRYYTGATANMIDSLIVSLRQGHSFSVSLLRFGFPKEVSNYLNIMEKHGDFHAGLHTAAELCSTRHQIREEAGKVLRYPVLMFVCLLVLVTLVLHTIIPQFYQFFSQTGAELPFISRMLFSLLTIINLPASVIALLVLLLTIKAAKHAPLKVKLYLITGTPLIQSYARMIFTYFFVCQIAPMLNNGLSMNDSLQMIRRDSMFAVFQQEAAILHQGMQQGISLSEMITERPVFDPQLSTIVALGEERGCTAEELSRYSRFLKERITYRIGQLLFRLQPILYAVIGILLLIVFVSLMMPVFQLTNLW